MSKDQDPATKYFTAQNNVGRKCPTKGCDGVLEYMESKVREGERCLKCNYWMFGRKWHE